MDFFIVFYIVLIYYWISILYLLIMLTQKQDVKEYIIDQLNDDVGLDQYIGDLHYYLLNEDY